MDDGEGLSRFVAPVVEKMKPEDVVRPGSVVDAESVPEAVAVDDGEVDEPEPVGEELEADDPSTGA